VPGLIFIVTVIVTVNTLRLLAHRVALRAAFVAIVAVAGPAFGQSPGAEPGNDSGRADGADSRSVMALDCAHLAGLDARQVLAGVPAPRIVLLQGSFAPVTMEPFAQFLIGMGYPESPLRNPADGALSYSSFADSLQLAGAVAWYYESDGMMPMLIGHSQGGMMVVRVLYELAGAFHRAIPVWNPVAGMPAGRTTITDPLTHVTRPALGLHLDYAAALATGKWPRIVLGQWEMVAKVHRIPDTVAEFSAFSIPWDPIAGNLAHPEPYEALGTARVRNVTLPMGTSHIGIPRASALASDARTHQWIDAYDPDHPTPLPDGADVDTSNLLHAADIWYSVRKHWCQSAQQLLRARGGT